MNDYNVTCINLHEARDLADWLNANIKSVKAEYFYCVVKIHKVEPKNPLFRGKKVERGAGV